jgi:hypothetical protein
MKMNSALAALCLATLSSFITTGCASADGDADTPQVAEDDVTISGLAAKLSALETSARGAQIRANQDSGREFWTKKYPKGTSHQKVLADVTGSNVTDIRLGDFSSKNGQSAIKDIADTVYAKAKELETEADETLAANSLKPIARALYSLKSSAPLFASVRSYSHSIAEDGDLQSDTLVFTKTDGSLLVFAYTDFPF